MKLLVIGLDSASPELVFDRLSGQLPHLSGLAQRGIYGELQSCIPPITIPAWMVMMTGKSPGELGLYGFRHRRGYSYSQMWIASSLAVKHPPVWDLLGCRSCLVGVPPSYPPKPVNGYLVSCFITPDASKEYTYPTELKGEIESLVGEYIFDIPFRREDREGFLKGLYQMSEKQFQVARYLLTKKEWDLFMVVAIGPDRVHHAFWKYFDESHHLYQPSPFKEVIPQYYRYLDEQIGHLLSLVDRETAVLVVSDHGVKGMRGAFCINQWLAQEGYLAFKENPSPGMSLEEASIDWERTQAWGWGGYYARIFLNVQGRETQGVIPASEYEATREKLAEHLGQVTGPRGERWQTRIFQPEDIYPQTLGDPPDLMVYLDNLYWRAAGSLGHPGLYLEENDTGPDDAVHAEEGLFLLYDPRVKGGKRTQATIFDIAPTILSLMGASANSGGRDLRYDKR